MTDTKKIAVGIVTAAVLWFFMFSPWTYGITNFYLSMTVSACILTALVLSFTKGDLSALRCQKPLLQVFLGIVIALGLWGIFWIGDKLSSLMFGFARGQVDAIYSMKEGFPEWLIALLLLFIIGPAEEFFWRGFVQNRLSKVLQGWRFPSDHAFLITTVIYALVHLPSMNFMLIMAALVAGSVWGFIYRLNPKLLPALIISHALWDALAFVILPI